MVCDGERGLLDDGVAARSIDGGGCYAWKRSGVKIPVMTLYDPQKQLLEQLATDQGWSSDAYVTLDFTRSLSVEEVASLEFWMTSHCETEEDCQKHTTFADVPPSIF